MKVKEDVNVRGRKAEAYLTDKAELEVYSHSLRLFLAWFRILLSSVVVLDFKVKPTWASWKHT